MLRDTVSAPERAFRLGCSRRAWRACGPVLVALLLVSAPPSQAKGDPSPPCPATYVAARGSALLLEQGTQEARKEAVQRALERAVEEVCAPNVESQRLYVTSSSGTGRSQVLKVEASGRATDWQLGATNIREPSSGTGDQLVAWVEVDLCVKVACDDVSKKDRLFFVGVELQGEDGEVVHSLRKGEKFSIRATPSQDAYLTILCIFPHDSGTPFVNRIYPNSFEIDPSVVPANATFTYPPEGLDDQDRQLVALLPQGKRVNDEVVWVIATKKPWHPFGIPGKSRLERRDDRYFLALDARPLHDWQQKLAEISGPQVTERLFTYTILDR